jgi:hypothetical protein
MSGHDELQGMIESIRRMGELGITAAPDVARVVDAELRRTIAAGTTPDGQPWQERQRGGKPLQNAGDALFVAAVGGTVYVRLKGPEARHHRGTARGGVMRQVIPSSSRLPAPLASKIKAVLVEHFDAAAGGGNG